MRIAVVISLISLCLGCVPYPVYKTLQPSSEMTVIDTNEKPIKDAQVTLISSSYPYGFEKSRETKLTDTNGKASFESKKEWRTESLMLHGVEIFFWNWCVYKDGYETYLTGERSDSEFIEEPIVVLKPGEANICPGHL